MRIPGNFVGTLPGHPEDGYSAPAQSPQKLPSVHPVGQVRNIKYDLMIEEMVGDIATLNWQIGHRLL